MKNVVNEIEEQDNDALNESFNLKMDLSDNYKGKDPENEEMQVRTDKQILQTIRNIKSQNNSKGEIICVDDLKDFCLANQFASNNNKEVFVCDALYGNSLETPICLVFSSKTCMKNLNYTLSMPNPTLAVDGTFKVNSLGYPLLCLTTLDANHQIFPVAMAPASSESEKTISFLLNSVLKTYNKIYKKDVNITYFMSDCGSHIFNAVKNTLGPLKGGHLSCFFHIKENQRKKTWLNTKLIKMIEIQF